MAKTRVSIRDVARESGVSLTTVSLVLNKNDGRISDATRERVLDAIQRLDYTPSRLARGLPNSQSKTLAVLVPALQHAFADVYFGEIISGIYEAAAERGFRIMLEVARRDYIKRREYLTVLDDCSVDGILFIGASEEHTWLSDFDGTDRPLLVVNNHFAQWDLHRVECDYALAGRLAADHLAGLGHTRIGHISGPVDKVATTADLTNAFVARLAERGVRLSDQLIVEGKLHVEFGKLACEELLARDPDLTAVFASNDKMALGAYQALREMGKRPGEDVSVMGCDDLATARLADPGLTTIKMNFLNVGAESCRHLIDLIRAQSGRSKQSNGVATNGASNGTSNGAIHRIDELLPVELVERGSVRAV